jgi:hypothetical protein
VVAFAGVAAVLLLTATVGAASLLRSAAPNAGNEDAALMMDTESASAPAPESAPQDYGERGALQTAPGYIVHGDRVYALAEAPAPSVLATAGVLQSDLGTGVVLEREVYAASSEPGMLFIVAEGKTYAFRRVERSFGGVRYALVSKRPLVTFGEWPSLPPDIPQPESESGWPVLSQYGYDEFGVEVFVLVQEGISRGIAIAPGQPTSDPGSGNPNWTWWEAVPD